jgi:hypothetical protein
MSYDGNYSALWNGGGTTRQRIEELKNEAGCSYGLASLAVVTANMLAQNPETRRNGEVCLDGILKMAETSPPMSLEAVQIEGLVRRGHLPTTIRKEEFMEKLQQAARRAGMLW